MFAGIRTIRNRMPDFPLTGEPRDKKVRTQHVEGIHKKKAEVANQIGANSCPNVVGSYSREWVNMDILKSVTIIRSVVYDY